MADELTTVELAPAELDVLRDAVAHLLALMLMHETRCERFDLVVVVGNKLGMRL